MPPMPLLSAKEIDQRLKQVDAWSLEDREIIRTFQFPNFVAALRFVARVGEKAEIAGHHPDIDIRYDHVRLALISHDAGGLTEKDFALAAECDQIFAEP